MSNNKNTTNKNRSHHRKKSTELPVNISLVSEKNTTGTQYNSLTSSSSLTLLFLLTSPLPPPSSSSHSSLRLYHRAPPSPLPSLVYILLRGFYSLFLISCLSFSSCSSCLCFAFLCECQTKYWSCVQLTKQREREREREREIVVLVTALI